MSLLLDASRGDFLILSLDERVLSPALGYYFKPCWLGPHESILSILWKFARANSLPGHVVAALLRGHIDPYEGVEPTRTCVDPRWLRASLQLPATTLRRALMSSARYRASSRTFRFCPGCLSRGYHCVAHQCERLQHCPLHGRLLECACRCCGNAVPYPLSAFLLDSPYRCPHCKSLYGNTNFSINSIRPFSNKTRARLRKLHSDHDCF